MHLSSKSMSMYKINNLQTSQARVDTTWASSQLLDLRLLLLLYHALRVHICAYIARVPTQGTVVSQLEQRRCDLGTRSPLRFTHASTEMPAKTTAAPSHWPSVSVWL